MALTIELKRETEARLASEARSRGLDLATYVARLLEEPNAVKDVLGISARTSEDARVWLEELTQFSDKIPPMPGEAFSREMIYQDQE